MGAMSFSLITFIPFKCLNLETLGFANWSASVVFCLFVSSDLVPDIQHLVLGIVPLGERPQGPGAPVQRGELCLSQQTAADHRRSEQDVILEGCHKGDVTVSISTDI